MDSLKKIIGSFKLKEELNPKIWDISKNNDVTLKEDVREKLLSIAYEFIDFIGVEILVSDVTMTGSLANYNWSEYSDVDLHVLADFDQFSEKERPLYEELFKLKKTLFNTQHDINIYDYEVELYVQNENEEHTSTGVYSVLFDEWVEKPSQVEYSVNKESIKKKSKIWMETIDTILDNIKDDSIEEMSVKIKQLKDKIKKFRSCGLEKGGEFSDENLVFKALRRNGYIGKVFDFEKKYIDKELTLREMMMESSEDKKKYVIKKWLIDNYGDLEKYVKDGYPEDYIFYMRDGETIFEYNTENGWGYINEDVIWTFLESMFSMEYEEIQEVTKEWLEEHYKLRVTLTHLSIDMSEYEPGEYHKLEVKNSLTESSEDKKKDIAKKWLTDNYGDMEIYDATEYPWSFYLTVDDKIILLYHHKDKELHMEDDDIPNFISTMFSMEPEEVKSSIKEWAQENYGLDVIKIIKWRFDGPEDWPDFVKTRTVKRPNNKNSLTESSDDKKTKLVKKWLTDNYGNLDEFETDKYPNQIFYMKDGEIMLQHNRKNGYCYIDYEKIWSFLEMMFSMKDEEIQEVTKEWVEDHYKLKVSTTPNWRSPKLQRVEDDYKLEVTTRPNWRGSKSQGVEDHYKKNSLT